MGKRTASRRAQPARAQAHQASVGAPAASTWGRPSGPAAYTFENCQAFSTQVSKDPRGVSTTVRRRNGLSAA